MRLNRHLSAITALTLSAGLSACASSPALDARTEHFGNAVAHNIEAQRVAPTPEQKANTFIPPNRARQKLAREAYEKGETPNPIQVGTTNDDE